MTTTETLANRYRRWYGDKAVWLFVRDLMAGDPSQFKAGYTRENAIIAAAEAFGMERSAVEEEVNKHDNN
jgi:hypothetical protein